MKKKTIKQLEDDLKYYEEFIKKCGDVIDIEQYTISSFSSTSKKSLSYEDIQGMALEKRYEICMKLISDSDFSSGSDKESENIHKAIMILYGMGFRELSATVNKIAVDYFVSKSYSEKIAGIKHQIKQRKINSKGGKARTSIHKDGALKIAADTWAEFPGASMESLSRKIYEYLNGKYRGIPEPGTIKTWLKNSGLNPEHSPKIKNYDLVVKQ
ncbi:hypothetical protein [Erwinia psidii]|uniref:Uncharacterized protein n=1 Tax=Erwinia psidii TaxID=69224 RepID=A0A3N6ULS2_9GAMM|nr:hypothetical protein [Erwinia psidii]MCX8959449.1 hypothetical protein [Erwinia psidii]MCX8964301.1 hypothetical protein [Erwinia psidii]RQM36869.1 hypothetical protein EB241_18045 [Erwinia psidii]